MNKEELTQEVVKKEKTTQKDCVESSCVNTPETEYVFRSINKKQLESVLSSKKLKVTANQAKVTGITNLGDKIVDGCSFFFRAKRIGYFGSKARAIIVLTKQGEEKISVIAQDYYHYCINNLLWFPEVRKSDKIELLAQYNELELGVDFNLIVLKSGQKIAKEYGFNTIRPDYVPDPEDITVREKHSHGWEYIRCGIQKIERS